MSFMSKTFLLLCLFGSITKVNSKVLLISMDGFRWDYINKADTPNFDEFAKMGTKADYLTPAFITKTFPCHYTIATGLYEETHGIVANRMYDPVMNKSFSMASKESFWWDGGEPIWVTVQRHGLRSAVYYWPGSEAIIRGKRPNHYRAYNESVSFSERIDTVISWLSNKTDDISLVMLYFHEPDLTGHKYGPSSSQVIEKVGEMDRVLGEIVKKMDENNFWDTVNVIVTSDHGMTDVNQETREIDLSEHINLNDIEHMPDHTGPIISIAPTPGTENEMFNNLSGIEHMSVYRKNDIPVDWHYKNNRRVLPLLLVADEGWLISKNSSQYKETDRGTHGFDNKLSSMKPIFFARGPKIRKGYVADPFNSVDIYPMVCKLLGIEGADNNGTLDNTMPFIADDSGSAAQKISIFPLTHIITIFGLYIIFKATN